MNGGPEGYAGLASRAAAFAIDASAVVVVCTAGFQVTNALLATIGITELDGDRNLEALGFVLLVPAAFWFYCATFWSLGGRTPGMMLLGLRVVKADGTPPGIRRSVLRATGYWLSSILLLGFAWIAIDRRSQGFHDKLAGTFVVYAWDAGVAPVG